MKTFDKSQSTAITNSFVSHVRQDPKRMEIIRNIKDSRITEEAFK